MSEGNVVLLCPLYAVNNPGEDYLQDQGNGDGDSGSALHISKLFDFA